jgi:hypothetical protein
LGYRYEKSSSGEAFGDVAFVAFPASVLAPGVLHFSYGEPGRGLGSVGGNLGGAIIGGFAGMTMGATACPKNEEGGSGRDFGGKSLVLGALAGMTVGRLLWAIVDIDGYSSKKEPMRLSAMPLLSSKGGATVIGVLGEF